MQEIDWVSDLNQLNKELPALHSKTFSSQEKVDFAAHIDTLKQSLSDLDNYTIATHIARIVATIGDAHTTALLPKHNRLPIDCYWFKEGIFVTSSLPEFANLCNRKITKIEDEPIDNIVIRLAEIIPHENQSFLMAQLPDFLICADILYGTGVLDDPAKVKMTLEDNMGSQVDVVLDTVKYEDNPSLQSQNDSDDLPLYLRNESQFYWSELADELLYFNYNKCKNMETLSVSEFTEHLISDIENNPAVKTLVIDIRNNGGGNSELLKDFLNWLSSFKRLNKKQTLFVIIGRDTFSSALLNAFYLEAHTNATFVGEPTGGKPNCYGEVKYLSLNSSGLLIRYSTKYYALIDDDDLMSFMPDVQFDVTFQDFSNNIDPCMNWILSQPL